MNAPVKDASKKEIPEGPAINYSEIKKKKMAPEAIQYKTGTKRKIDEEEQKWWE